MTRADEPCAAALNGMEPCGPQHHALGVACGACARCQVCGGKLPEGNTRNCSRRCNVNATDRRRKGQPIDDAAFYAQLKRRLPARFDDRQPPEIRKLKRRRDWLRAELERVNDQVRAFRSRVSS